MNTYRFTKGAYLFSLATLIATVQPAWAETAMAHSHSHELVITSVEPDDPNQRLIINGWNFGTSEGDVFLQDLQDDPLPVVSWSDTEIVVDLADGLQPATYLLTVRNGGGTTRHDTFDVTIGAVGPAGPPGPGISGYEVIRSDKVFDFGVTDFVQTNGTSASCSTATKRLLGGGVIAPPGTAVLYSRPFLSADPNAPPQWLGGVTSLPGITLQGATLYVYAICADIP